MAINPRSQFSHTRLCWTATPAETDVLDLCKNPTIGVSATNGNLVYEDAVDGHVMQVVEAEFLLLGIVPINARKLLTSGTITLGAGATALVSTTAENVRIYT